MKEKQHTYTKKGCCLKGENSTYPSDKGSHQKCTTVLKDRVEHIALAMKIGRKMQYTERIRPAAKKLIGMCNTSRKLLSESGKNCNDMILYPADIFPCHAHFHNNGS